MYSKILVPLDGSKTAENVLPLARSFARALQIPVELLGVIDASTPVRMDQIFVPLDGSALAEKALPHACALSKKLNLEIQLLRVYSLPMDAYVVADGVIARGPAQYREELAKQAQDYLEGKVAGLRADRVERVVGTALEGDAASEIIDLASKTPDSLIGMSTHGRSGIAR